MIKADEQTEPFGGILAKRMGKLGVRSETFTPGVALSFIKARSIGEGRDCNTRGIRNKFQKGMD